MECRGLTKRQAEVAERVGRGMTDKAIARDLGISVFTVREYVRDAAERLQGHYGAGWPRHQLLLWFLNVRED